MPAPLLAAPVLLAARLVAPMIAARVGTAVAARGATAATAQLAGRAAGQATIATGQYAANRMQQRQAERRGGP